MPLTIKDPFRTPYGAFKGALRDAFKGVASATPIAQSVTDSIHWLVGCRPSTSTVFGTDHQSGQWIESVTDWAV